MGDLSYIDRDLEVKIVGQNATGDSVNYVSADVSGNMLVKDYSDGPVTPGTVASASSLIGGQFNTALPTLTNTQQSAIQLDASGRLIIRPLTSADVVSAVQSGAWTTGRTWTLASGTDSVSAIQGTSPWVSNISQFGGSNIVTGTGASGAGIPRVTVSNDSNVLATQSGTWTVQQGTPPWTIQGDSASGASKAGNPVQIGGVFNTTQPTVTTGQTVEAQSTSRGAQIVATGIDAFTVQPGNTANTTPWLVTDSSDGPVTPGTAASKASLIAGQYKTTLPVASDGQQVAIQVDQNGRLLTSASVVSSLPAATFSKQDAINSGSTTYTVFTAAQKLAIKQFYAGGTGIGKQAIYSYSSASTQFVSFGDFESTGDVSNWIYTTNGGSGVLAFSTAQHFTGSGSMSLTFTTSDTNHLNGAKQTFSPAQDFSGWRYITAEFFNTVSSGGAYTRNIAIILTDSNGSTRTYLVSGLSTASPFNASGWIQILGEVANPSSSTGVSFDPTAIANLEIRQWDSANKSGTVYWDTVRLQSAITPIFPIYHQANTSFNISIDPVFVMNTSDQMLLAQTNNDTTRQEYYAFAGGVAIT